MSISTPGFRSHLAVLRTRAGITQESLAARAGVSRQALGLIEAGRSVPSTALALKLASLLGKQVEDLFGLDESPSDLDVRWVGGEVAARGLVGLVGQTWVAHALDPRDVTAADVLGGAGNPSGRARLIPPGGQERLRERLLISGCAPALGLLVQHLRSGPDPVNATWIHATTESALAQLTRGETHVAGVHLLAGDEAGHRRPGRRQSLTLARWRQGLLVRRDRRTAPRRIEDLGRRGIRVVRRESGASANRLLDQCLERSGVRVTGPTLQARGHFGVAQAVAWGAADVGVAAEHAALAHDLGFIPLDDERFDLVFPRARADDPRIVRLGEVLTSRAFREDLASLGGYDTSNTGARSLAVSHRELD